MLILKILKGCALGTRARVIPFGRCDLISGALEVGLCVR
jgi:hypothetical protein